MSEAQRQSDVVLGVVVAAREPDTRFPPHVMPCVPSYSCQDRTVMISPLPSLPMICAGGGLVLNAMVNVVPEAVASITLDWSGPVRHDVAAAAVDRVREVLDRRCCGRGVRGRGSCSRRPAHTPDGNPMVACAVPPHGMISPEPTGFVDVIRTHSSHGVHDHLRARRAACRADVHPRPALRSALRQDST